AQADFVAVELAKQMQKLALEPAAMTGAAQRARSVGRPLATQQLADLVEQSGGQPLMDVIRVGGGNAGAPVRATATNGAA
ncbi:MAG: UDP-N-acetylglucosamine--N-acetylmuramyl-(pentapeptide) pyrophosphoryl-undecaprenol N-acetylglucosamine transferase, partial [Sphingopyxis sp.]